jgi:SAM-dependent methyltransferase
MPKIRPFEQHGDAYDQWFEKNADKYRAELEVIRRLLPLRADSGMEVGVGSGRFAGPLGIRFGVEPSHRMAQKALRRGLEVVSGAAESLPFRNGVFDLVLMVTTICFVDDVTASFAEANRVMKRDGAIIVGFVDGESLLGKQYQANRDRSKFYRDAVFFSVNEVRDYLKDTGFRVEKIIQTLMPGDTAGAVLEGFGKGAFVGIKGVKQAAPEHCCKKRR